MNIDTITFELATHYLPKIALKLECLYRTVEQACEEIHPVIHHYALKNIIEIIKIAEKPELKSRFLKELIRIEHTLNKSETEVSNPLYNSLHSQIQMLTHVVGCFGRNIHQNAFLQSVRISQPAQTNDYEMYSPQLLLWLESDPFIRQRDLTQWLMNFDHLYTTVTLYLSLLRDTAQFDEIEFNGFYQRALPPKTSCHLVLLRINKSFGIVPRMQLGNHGLSLRLCEINTMRDIPETRARIDLGICQL